MSRASIDQLKHNRKVAKQVGDYLTGVTTAQEMVERRGWFEDYCWLAWFEQSLGSVVAARIAIHSALEIVPEHPAALKFLQELDKADCDVQPTPDETASAQPSGPNKSVSGQPAGSTQISPEPAPDSIDELRRQAADAADAHDWRAVMQSAQELVNRVGGFEHLCWLIRAEIQLDLYGRAESNLKRARKVMPSDRAAVHMLWRLSRELDDRVSARRSTDLYIVVSSLPLTDETIWLVMKRPANEIARFKTEESAKKFLDERIRKPTIS